MTHKDIYIKFMIEYDKANVTSSYPSLTEYEVATVLDKAYNALIAQKVTGNNYRRAALEADIKSVSDLQGLIVTDSKNRNTSPNQGSYNEAIYPVPTDFLYFISAQLERTVTDIPMDVNPKPANVTRPVNVDLVDHRTADKFVVTDNNMPWIKTPKAYIENNEIHVLYDPIDTPTLTTINITYIKTPNKFLKDNPSLTYFDWAEADKNDATVTGKYQFECNDTVAGELVSLAVAFALENVESQRLNTKLNMRGLEA